MESSWGFVVKGYHVFVLCFSLGKEEMGTPLRPCDCEREHLSVLYLWGGEEVGRGWCSIIMHLETILALFFGMKHWCSVAEWIEDDMLCTSEPRLGLSFFPWVMLMIWVCDLSASCESKNKYIKKWKHASFFFWQWHFSSFLFSGWLDPFFKFCWFSHLRTEQGVDTG